MFRVAFQHHFPGFLYLLPMQMSMLPFSNVHSVSLCCVLLSLQQADLCSVTINIVGNWLKELCHLASGLVIWSSLYWSDWSVADSDPCGAARIPPQYVLLVMQILLMVAWFLYALAVSLARFYQLIFVLTPTKSVLHCCGSSCTGHAVGVNISTRLHSRRRRGSDQEGPVMVKQHHTSSLPRQLLFVLWQRQRNTGVHDAF